MKINDITKAGLALAAVAGVFSLTSCRDEYDGSKLWDGNAEIQVPDMKPRYVWVDAAANFNDFANNRENITRDLTLAKEVGFTDVVVDVRPTTGDILFNSPLCDKVTSLNAWVGGSKITVYRTETWDYLQAFIDDCRSLGLRVHAGFNTMVGGHRAGGPEMTPGGVLFRDADKAEWANWLYNGGNPKSALECGVAEGFFNPGHPAVQEYLCGLLADLAKYDLDGIILDRGRYNNLFADFSPTSQAQFEEYVGVKFHNFPADILPAGSTETTLGEPYAKYTTKWLEFRAKTIYEFMGKAREAVKAVNPDVLFGAYVGGWYNSYYNTGVNWASQTYDPSRNCKWASARYKKFGYAGLMDQILIGAYANPTAVNGTTEWTMEGFCLQAKKKIGSACPLVVGGPDVDWRWEGSNAVYSQEQILDGIRNSVPACINVCDGYFLFDMIHLKIDPDKWDAVKYGVQDYVDAYNAKYGPKDPEAPVTPAE